MRTMQSIGSIALAASFVMVASFVPSTTPVLGFAGASEALAFQEVIPRSTTRMFRPSGPRMLRHGGRGWGGGRGVAAGAAAGLIGGLLITAIAHSYAEDQETSNRVDCFRIGCNEFHFSNVPGKPAVEIVLPPKLKRVNCANGRCKPIKYGQYRLWPYTDANGNKFAKLTDSSGNPSTAARPGDQIKGYTIIH